MSFKAISRTITGWVGKFSDLDDDVRQMFYVARTARLNAQAPYSNYYVGVAVQGQSHRIYSGCNVERASWTQTTHAEQNAIDSMVASEGPVKLIKLVLVAAPKDVSINFCLDESREREIWKVKFPEISVPCGHCLQCIWENCYGDGSVKLYSLMPTGEVSMVTVDNAFPLRFGPADLDVDYGKIPT
ncbi:MAG: hypothetical protein HYT62_00545 [Candidatus Yanofskybacteria bacterium]|nr:hypothetical protein [Candidatus Yanofskybacteria bacterium]